MHVLYKLLADLIGFKKIYPFFFINASPVHKFSVLAANLEEAAGSLRFKVATFTNQLIGHSDVCRPRHDVQSRERLLTHFWTALNTAEHSGAVTHVQCHPSHQQEASRCCLQASPALKKYDWSTLNMKDRRSVLF